MSKFKVYYSDPEFKSRYLARQKEQIICSTCGAIVTRNSYYLHSKSKKHSIQSTKSDETMKLEKKRASIKRSYNRKIKETKKRKRRRVREIRET